MSDERIVHKHQPEIRKLKNKAAELAGKKKFKEALVKYARVLELDPEDLYARHKAADLLVAMGQKAKALEQLQRIAGRYALEGSLLKAIATLKIILKEVEPGHTETLETLAHLYARQLGPGAAAAELRQVGAGGLKAIQRVQVSPDQMPKTPLLSDLGRTEFVAVLQRLELEWARAKDRIVTEGELGDAMYIVVRGKVDVARETGQGEPRVVARMGDGAFFGEMALMVETPRFASVIAVTNCALLKISRETFTEICQRYPRIRQVVSDFFKDRLAKNLLRSMPVFQSDSTLVRKHLIHLFKISSINAGTKVLAAGDKSDGLYIVLRGTCDVFYEDNEGVRHEYPSIGEGDFFGEISLLRKAPATATVRASSDCVVLKLGRADFEKLIPSFPEFKASILRVGAERIKRTSELLKEKGA